MKTEIFGTFGPACATEEIIEKMIDAGMTGMRLNLSHTTLKTSENYIKAYQAAARKAGVEPGILIDMQGPELRIGTLKAPLNLKESNRVCLCSIESYNHEEVSVDMIPVPRKIIDVLESGDEILLDDGRILIQMIADEKPLPSEKKYVLAKVCRGGYLTSGKSIKVKEKYISLPPLTDHDIENIKVAKSYGVKALMQPFVQSGEELRKVRSVLKENNAEDVQIFAKIENRIGVEHIQDILPEADVIVIARGDLGNDMPLWELPKVQKEIEEACKMINKPYVVVTQMLASMEQNPVPTRAEVSDIFHAVYHGAWGVMVTGETAVGKYPVEAIQYLSNTAQEVDNYLEKES